MRDLLPLVTGDERPAGHRELRHPHLPLEDAPGPMRSSRRSRNGTFKVVFKPHG